MQIIYGDKFAKKCHKFGPKLLMYIILHKLSVAPLTREILIELAQLF